jgi:voltage-gated potassium channel
MNSSEASHQIHRERTELLRQWEHALELPMLLLGLAWLALLVADFTRHNTRALETAGTVIWVVFLIDFAVRLTLTPKKVRFLRQQWLTVLALLVPALRLFRAVRLVRVFRAARAVRGVRFVRLLTSMNRGFRALRTSMGRRGLGFVLALAVLVIFAGAAGIFAFEADENPGIHSYSAALWWTAMMITTVGSDYFPRSLEGRILCLLLATFAFAIWGYLTATLATFFVDRDAASNQGEVVGAKQLDELRGEIRALREAVERLR